MQPRSLLPKFARGAAVTLAGALLLVLPAASAQAQVTKIFVASFGNDTNDGSRGSPKRNFQNAHDAVATGGQIVVLDTAGYGALNITKSVAITVPPGVNGFVTVTGTNNGITVNAGAGDKVSLRGLIIEGGGSRDSTGISGRGLNVPSVGYLSVEDCTIRNFLIALPFIPTNGGRLSVSNTTVRNCRYGIDVRGLNGIGSTAVAVISGCRLENLGDAVYATAFCITDLADCVIANCDTAIHFSPESGLTFVSASDCKFYNVGNNPIAGADSNNFKIASTYGNNTATFSAGYFNGGYPLK